MPFGVIARRRSADPPVISKRRLASWQVHHAEVREEHPVPKAGPEGLGGGFLGREPFGKGSGPDGLGSPQRPRPLGFREYAVEEAGPVPLDGFFDASDVADVGADAEDHGFAGVGTAERERGRPSCERRAQNARAGIMRRLPVQHP